MSRYDLFRRRIAPIAFFIAIALIARDSCEKNKRVHTTVELVWGEAKPAVRGVDVQVMVGSDVASTFHRVALPDSVIGPCKFELALPEDDGELQIDVDLGGEHRRLTRKFHLVEGSTMEVSLGADLKPRQ